MISRFLKTVPGCRVSVSFPVSSHQLYPGGRGRLARYLGVKTPSSPFLSFFLFLFLNTRQWRFFHLLWKKKLVWIVKSFVSYTLSNPDKGPVIIYHLRGRGGGEGTRRILGEISRNWEPKRGDHWNHWKLWKDSEGGPLKFAWKMKTLRGWGGGARRSSNVISDVAFKGGTG